MAETPGRLAAVAWPRRQGGAGNVPPGFPTPARGRSRAAGRLTFPPRQSARTAAGVRWDKGRENERWLVGAGARVAFSSEGPGGGERHGGQPAAVRQHGGDDPFERPATTRCRKATTA